MSGAAGERVGEGRRGGRLASTPYGQAARAHPPGGRLPPLVPGRRRQGGDGRQRTGARHDGHPPLRLRHLGADAGRGRPPHQGRRRQERLLPTVHPRELPEARGRARRGLQPRAGRGHPRRWQGAGGARRGAAHLRDRHRRVHGQVDPELPRPAAAVEPVGQRRALGAAAPGVPAHERVPLAGGPHRPRQRAGRSPLRRAHPPRGLRRVHARRARHPGRGRPQDAEGALRRRHEHHGSRGDDGRRQGPPDGHQPRAGPELRQGLRHPVPRRRGHPAARLDHLVGRSPPCRSW
jgi:hypothetical protein